MSSSEIWWSSMAVTTRPQPTDTLRLTWTEDADDELDLHRYDHYAQIGKVLELNAVFTEFDLVGRQYRVTKVTRRTPFTHDVEFNSVTLELRPVGS